MTRSPARKSTRAAGSAVPHINNATDLLLTSEAGNRVFLESTQFSSNLSISKSGIAAAGNGLYVMANDSDIILEAGQIITWFSGQVEFYDEKNFPQMITKQYTIGLGASVRQAAPVIISNPQDYNLMGCAHFANHSTKPNCVLDYLQGTNGINAVVLKIKKKTIVPQGYALELVFNYGKSAMHIHNIEGVCDYIPAPKTIEQLLIEDANYYANIYPEYLNGFEIDMPKSREYSSGHLRQVAQKFLPPGTFDVVENPDLTVFASMKERPETFFFIKIIPELSQHCWILMRFQRANNQVFLYDPEGLLFDKITPQWLNSLATPVVLCHSWFVFSKYKKDPEYQRTGSICIELAKSVFEGATLEHTEILLPAKAHWPRVTHCNLNSIISIGGIDPSPLNRLLVKYPEQLSSNSPDDRAAAIENILEQQKVTEEAALDIAGIEFGDVAYEIPIKKLFSAFDTAIEMHIPEHSISLLQQTGSSGFFAANAKRPLVKGDLGRAADLSSLKNILAYYQLQGLIVMSDSAIEAIANHTTPEIQTRLHTQCLDLILQPDASQLQLDLTQLLSSIGYQEPAQSIPSFL